MNPWLQAALAGVGAAAVWGIVEPLDRRVFGFPYSDIALLGLLVTRGPHWRAVGWALHIANGAIAGLVFSGRSSSTSVATHSGSRSGSQWSSISSPTR